jgi:hypothetical protein
VITIGERCSDARSISDAASRLSSVIGAMLSSFTV